MSAHQSAAAGPGTVVSVQRAERHEFSKPAEPSIELIAGLGVAGDAHCGARVKHRSRVAADPEQPNLRQVHLMAGELFERVAGNGFSVAPGDLGENITTGGIDLINLPVGSVLAVGQTALLAVTGLRNPCGQIEGFADGLLDEVRYRDTDGAIVRLAGIMAVVVSGGVVAPGDPISVALPPPPHRPLQRV